MFYKILLVSIKLKDFSRKNVELSGDVTPQDLDIGVTYNVDPVDDTLVIQ